MSVSAEIETYKKNRAYLEVEIQKITDDPILNLSDYENLERSYTFLKNDENTNEKYKVHFPFRITDYFTKSSRTKSDFTR